MTTAELVAYAAIFGVVLTLLRDVVNGAWRLGNRFTQFEDKIMAVIQGHKKEENEALLRAEAEIEHTKRSVAARFQAVDAQHNDFEKWVRDEFVRKQSFEFALQRIEKTLDKLDSKLDRVSGHGQAGGV